MENIAVYAATLIIGGIFILWIAMQLNEGN